MKTEEVQAIGQTLHDALSERGRSHGEPKAAVKLGAALAALTIGFAENLARIADAVEEMVPKPASAAPPEPLDSDEIYRRHFPGRPDGAA